MKKTAIILAIVLFSTLAYSQNCKEIEKEFYNYQQARKLIKSSDFAFSDKCNTGRSSWIAGAEYYSCDNKTGFFIMKTNRGNNYLHKNLPKRVWYQFKNAASFGRFYNENIKKKYQLIL